MYTKISLKMVYTRLSYLAELILFSFLAVCLLKYVFSFLQPLCMLKAALKEINNRRRLQMVFAARSLKLRRVSFCHRYRFMFRLHSLCYFKTTPRFSGLKIFTQHDKLFQSGVWPSSIRDRDSVLKKHFLFITRDVGDFSYLVFRKIHV